MECEPGFAVGDVGKGQIRGVAGVRVGDHVGGCGPWEARDREERVEQDAFPPHVELGPRRDAVDGAVVHVLLDGVHLVP